ncbi:uncharacterized protein B0I36DRAFT_356291 [Microdochium trichocladiopsis]|uniref:Uncharacterized protein n=1 Tax=Microdochium trichocladiopsis TaxID=1682393 RepID=A0A9P9BFJ6_9PEZI|nr:uncharacterized protein B0I36DRAFT_356291 [Microdochium trichocladiopsis]KAH7012210.1 hypothetical protein B0I36DRAFT_356291 [Microdochium trichocladiopsis]
MILYESAPCVHDQPFVPGQVLRPLCAFVAGPIKPIAVPRHLRWPHFGATSNLAASILLAIVRGAVAALTCERAVLLSNIAELDIARHNNPASLLFYIYSGRLKNN